MPFLFLQSEEDFDVQKERVRISKERSRPGWTTSDSLRLERYMKKYPMNQESLVPGLLSFAKVHC